MKKLLLILLCAVSLFTCKKPASVTPTSVTSTPIVTTADVTFKRGAIKTWMCGPYQENTLQVVKLAKSYLNLTTDTFYDICPRFVSSYTFLEKTEGIYWYKTIDEPASSGCVPAFVSQSTTGTYTVVAGVNQTVIIN